MSKKYDLGLTPGIPLGVASNWFINVKTAGAPCAPRINGMAIGSGGIPKPKMPVKMASDGSPPPAAPPAPADDYFAQEQELQTAQEANEAKYYQQKAQQAQSTAQQMQSQVAQLSQQVQQLSSDVESGQQQIQMAQQQAQMATQGAMQNVAQAHQMASQATQQAMESQQEVLRNKQLAAAMRMGALQLKDQVMGALAQDPTEQLAPQLSAPPPSSLQAAQPMVDPATGQPVVDPATGQPVMQQPGQPGDPAAAGGPPGAEGEKPKSESKPSGGEKKKSEGSSEKKDSSSKKKDSGTEVTVKHSSVADKMRSVLPYVLAGGLIGGGSAYMMSGQSNDHLRADVSRMEGEEGGFGHALNLAQKKMRLATREVGEKHPLGATLLGTSVGALAAVSNGPKFMDDARLLRRNLKELMR